MNKLNLIKYVSSAILFLGSALIRLDNLQLIAVQEKWKIINYIFLFIGLLGLMFTYYHQSSQSKSLDEIFTKNHSKIITFLANCQINEDEIFTAHTFLGSTDIVNKEEIISTPTFWNYSTELIEALLKNLTESQKEELKSEVLSLIKECNIDTTLNEDYMIFIKNDPLNPKVLALINQLIIIIGSTNGCTFSSVLSSIILTSHVNLELQRYENFKIKSFDNFACNVHDSVNKYCASENDKIPYKINHDKVPTEVTFQTPSKETLYSNFNFMHSEYILYNDYNNDLKNSNIRIFTQSVFFSYMQNYFGKIPFSFITSSMDIKELSNAIFKAYMYEIPEFIKEISA